jgi:hypothetical protein
LYSSAGSWISAATGRPSRSITVDPRAAPASGSSTGLPPEST